MLFENHNFVIDDLLYKEDRFGYRLMTDYSIEGITTAEDNESYLPPLKRDADGYFIISSVVEGSPFDQLDFNLRPGDRIVSVNKIPVNTLSDDEYEDRW